MHRDDNAGHRAFALPGSSLRYGPDKTVDVLHIDLELRPDLEKARLDGICTTSIRALDEPVAWLELDAVDMRVRVCKRGEDTLRFAQRDRKLIVHFDPPLAADEQAAFSVHYRVEHPRQGLFFIEPTPEYPQKVRHAWTQSQDENARYWFPCLDYPHEKQTTSATIIVPKGQFALSNGALVERRDSAEVTTFVYRQDVPHSTYLVTLVVGPFVEVEQERAGVPISYYVLPGREADGERAFGNTPKMMRVFEEKIGLAYPYARYSQIAVSDFIFGGMENTSATTQTDRTLHDARAHIDFSSDPLVAHELAHQWFGDLLTCRDWSHAWLNEGFATFFEAVFREADLGSDEYLYDIFGCVERYLSEEADRYSRPIVCNRYRDPIELFDRHLYEKGGAVLHMLRGELGEARFWRAIRRYVTDNAQRNVETIDLIRAIEASTGRNLRGFFDQWVFRGGHPKLSISAAYDSKRRVATLTIDQKQNIGDENAPYVFDVDVAFAPESSDAQERRIRVHVERAHETVTVPLEFEPKLVRFDPGAFILADVTYQLGTDFAAAALANDPDPIARIRAARELAKEGSLTAREALARAFASERFWGVLAQTAYAVAKTHTPWAQDLLLQAAGHDHPKVRRAVASALGEFRDDRVAARLIEAAASDESYFVQAAALHSLGKTRDPRAFAVLRSALDAHSWNGVVESGAALGLGELADERVTAVLRQASRPGIEEGLRRAAIAALARHGELVESQRTEVVEAIHAALDDPAFLISHSAVLAAEHLSDRRFLPALDRLARAAEDARIRREAFEAEIRIRESQKVPAQVTTLRTDLDALREEQRKIQERLEALSRT
ncbi:MAG TPA: M1 family aminopeptidase [Candidatus Baltobacteraceae bacterium]|jgi:aminopeptidase N|nr:M1 family aminopeptidase [Candidatus Baltobacteraceae bacterium]